MPDFPVVDAHVHFYDPARLTYPWLVDVPAIAGAHGPKDYAKAATRTTVDKMVFVEVDARPEDRFAEAGFIATLQKSEPRIAGIVASALLEHGAQTAAAEISRLKALGPLCGIRRQIQNQTAAGWCTTPDFIAGVRTLAHDDLPFDICIKHEQLPDAIELVSRCPDIRFVLDHIAKPPIRTGGFQPWATNLRRIAAMPNVVCKMTGVTTEAHHADWTPAIIRPYIDHAFSCFGTERMLFCSDWPVLTMSDSFKGWVALLDDVLTGASEAARRDFFRNNAIRTYRLA